MSDFDPAKRALAIWSTESAAAHGLSSRRTRAQLWAEKRGLSDGSGDIEADNIPARLGLACQDGVAQMHKEDTGHDLVSIGHIAPMLEVSGVPLGSHFDFFNRTLKALHEVKFFGMGRRREFGEPGSGVVPYDVLLQALHEMVVWNAEKTGYAKAEACEVDVVFGNVERAVFVIPYDQQAVEKMLVGHAEFWALVQSNKPPEPQSPDDARRIWAKADGSEKVALPQTVAACQALGGLKKQIKSLEAQAETMELFVQRAMETSSVLRAPDGYVLATWNSTSTDRVDIKRLRAEMPQVAEKFLKTTDSRRFLLKG